MERQWPTLVLGVEWLFVRPGRFDFGVYTDLQLGSLDEDRGFVTGAVGLTTMWRFVENSFYDLAAVVRGSYVIDWSNVRDPMLRTGIGVQASLLRFVAVQLMVFEALFATSRAFSNREHVLFGISVALKWGIAPMCESWPQSRGKPPPSIDRSRLVCEDATRVCEAAGSAQLRDRLCSAALTALDPSVHSSGFRDASGAFLIALREQVATDPALLKLIDEPLAVLQRDHASSLSALDAYAEKQRALSDSQVLSHTYNYLVTPVMLRDWLGCDASEGAARDPSGNVVLPCPAVQTCERDTGVLDAD
jgi:hypothetical protein